MRHLEQALRTQEVLDPDDKAKRCDLLLAQVEAMLPQEEPGRVASSVAPEAFALAETLADSARAARAAVLACESLFRSGVSVMNPAAAAGLSQLEEWATRADRHALPSTAERVYADIYQSQVHIGAARPAEGHVYLRRAVDLALELDDTALVFAASGWALFRLLPLQDREMVEQLAHEILRRPREGARATDVGNCLLSAGHVLLRMGERASAEAIGREIAQLASTAHDASLTVLAIEYPAQLTFMDGRIEEAIAVCDAAAARALELGVREGRRGTSGAGELPFYLGRGTEEELKHYEGPGRPAQATRAQVLAYLGRHQEAHAIRERFGDVGSPTDETATHILLKLLEVAILGGDVETVRSLVPRLAPLAGHLALGYGTEFPGSIARLLGDAWALLGKPDAARAYYQQALEVCAKVRFRPEIAIVRLHLAELLLNHYPNDQPEAQAHLDFAIAEFREMKMQPYLERALRHKGLLHA